MQKLISNESESIANTDRNEKTINQKKVVAIGDGANDLGMLNYSGLGIGYNAHQIIKDNIKNQIFYTDLKSVLFFLGINEIEFTK